MTQPPNELEMLKKRQRAAFAAHPDDPDHRQKWSQYHHLLQAMYERGVLVYSAAAVPPDGTEAVA